MHDERLGRQQVQRDQCTNESRLGSGQARLIEGPLCNLTVAPLVVSSGRLESDSYQPSVVPGTQVNAEIHLGTRTVLEYLLSPVQRVAHEAGLER